MRPILFVLIASLFLASCEQDEFAKAKVQIPDTDQLKEYVGSAVEDDDNSEVKRDYCIEVGTSNWMSGYGSTVLLRQATLQNVQQNSLTRAPKDIYQIKASGEGFSEEFARSKSEMEYTFNTATNRIEGRMITFFHNGEVLEQYFEGEALVTNERSAIVLKAKVVKGELRSPVEAMRLVKGEIVIALPLKPEGWFETNVYSIGMYCTGDFN